VIAIGRPKPGVAALPKEINRSRRLEEISRTMRGGNMQPKRIAKKIGYCTLETNIFVLYLKSRRSHLT
jgi:hypothetical protein